MQTPGSTADESAARACPSQEEVRAQLERILSSCEFPSGGRGAAFLKYVTEETLAGRANRLKAYSVAIEVFHRSTGFTQDDPVVRIEAGRLRRVIERYYLVAGQHDPIRIDIPKGGYVPTFTWNDEPGTSDDHKDEFVVVRPQLEFRRPGWAVSVILVALLCAGLGYYAGMVAGPGHGRSPANIPDEPTLVIAPFADLGEGQQASRYAAGLTEELLTALPRFKEIKVFGRESSKSLSSKVNASQVRGGLGAHYLLAGSVRIAEDNIRVTARLVDTADGSILWSQKYDEAMNSSKLFAIQTDVASKVAATIAQPYGVIAKSIEANPPPDDVGVQQCMRRFYAYRAELTPDAHLASRDCLLSAINRFPEYATAWSMLSIIHLDEDRFKLNPQPEDKEPALQRALGAARRAVSLEPDNTRALQALMIALFFNSQAKEAFEVGEEALASNPNDTEFLGEFGTRVAYSGQWERGAELLDRAIKLNPGGAGYYFGTRALIACMLEDHETAVRLIRKADLQKFPLFHAVAAVIYSEAGLIADAKREGEVFIKMRPDYLPNIVAENRKRNFPPRDSMRMITALRRVGLPVPSAADVEAEFKITEASYGP